MATDATKPLETTFVDSEVTDAAGASLGRVIKEGVHWVLVEKVGLFREATVVMADEFESIGPGWIRLRVGQADMRNRSDRPGVADAANA